MMDPDEARAHLAQERERLQDVKAGFDADGLGANTESENLGELSDVDQHQADIGTETFDRERDFSILEQVDAELADVERALQRLDEGTYGTCEACGEAIEPERLEALPAARFCLKHQTAAENSRR